jgi:tetratricopeptide (TPR) repeat protein
MGLDPLANLLELTRIVSSVGPKRTQYLTRTVLRHATDLNARFYRLLQARGAISETEIASELLHTNPHDPLYKVHKSQFKHVLLNSLFFLDFEEKGHPSPKTIEYKNNRDVFLSKSLLSLGSNNAAATVAKPALQRAMKYELWQNALCLLSILRDISAFNGNSKEFAFYVDSYTRLATIETSQQGAFAAVSELMLAFSHTGGEREELASRARRHLTVAESSYKKYKTFGLALALFRLRSSYHQITKDYRATLDVCLAFEKQLLKRFKLLSSTARLAEVALKTLVCYLQIQDYEKGLKAVNRCKHLFPTTSNNWFAYKEYEFLLYMRLLQFDQARLSFADTINNPRFIIQPQHRQQRWEIYSLYLDYAERKTPRIERLNDLLKYAPLYSRDKKGFNASILVLHSLILLDQGRLREVVNRTDALKVYRSRYFRSGTGTQVVPFLKLIQILENSSFDPRKAMKKGAKLLMELDATNDEVLDGIQILPYRWIWDRVLSSLKGHKPAS